MNTRGAGRPVNCRHVQELPKITCFRPYEGSCNQMNTVLLTVDELEAIRLADKEGYYHKDAAIQMNVSRPTFGRILESGHKKVADALVEGKQLCIEGGVVSSKTLP